MSKQQLQYKTKSFKKEKSVSPATLTGSGDIKYMYWDRKGYFLLGIETLKIGVHGFQLPSC